MRWCATSEKPTIEYEVEWEPRADGRPYPPSFEPWAHLSAALANDRRTQQLVAQLKARPCIVEKVVDARETNGDEYQYLVKWQGFPDSQNEWKGADIFTPEEAAAWWGEPTIDDDELRRNGDWWIKLRYETKGIHAHEFWHLSSSVQEEHPHLMESWGVNLAERRKSNVWEEGGTYEEPVEAPACILQDLQAVVWCEVVDGYNAMLWNLYQECISSDRTRNPQYKIRMPQVRMHATRVLMHA